MSLADAELRYRESCGTPDPPAPKPVASFDTLTERIRQVAAARRAEDRTACRMELRELAKEAAKLAEQEELRL